MINAWKIEREERHVDLKVWVFLDKKDALKVAEEIRDYWLGYYDLDIEETDTELYRDVIFYCSAEDVFSVTVSPFLIREKGETEQVN